MAKTPPTDDVRPEAKPHGTTADQVAEMESEGQAQSPHTTPETGRARRRRAAGPDEVTPPAESAAEDQAIDTTATGLVSSDEDESRG